MKVEEYLKEIKESLEKVVIRQNTIIGLLVQREVFDLEEYEIHQLRTLARFDQVMAHRRDEDDA